MCKCINNALLGWETNQFSKPHKYFICEFSSCLSYMLSQNAINIPLCEKAKVMKRERGDFGVTMLFATLVGLVTLVGLCLRNLVCLISNMKRYSSGEVFFYSLLIQSFEFLHALTFILLPFRDMFFSD
ncbi:hypothetical protein TorRG33x02_254780 [Trema orientale]|uniref:Uncharacterized protein n=1 Tax=Trema orientale TaxID=63057 RepID=A0A2P5DD13_TREOI|nr:hypothetical protein TorRG33x02_254780 [Trema orientale]